MALVKKFGEMWARNPQNIKLIPGSNEGGKGVYVLYDGSMPMYIGMGNLRRRIRKAKSHKQRGQMWDHFSWYVLTDSALMHDVEALLLRTLPSYLRSLNGQNGELADADQIHQKKEHQVAEFVSRTRPKRKRSRAHIKR